MSKNQNGFQMASKRKDSSYILSSHSNAFALQKQILRCPSYSRHAPTGQSIAHFTETMYEKRHWDAVPFMAARHLNRTKLTYTQCIHQGRPNYASKIQA